jgi:rhodanese-related sulfurtransferase
MGFIDNIKKLFGGSGADLGEIIGSGAKIIDVRTPGEFAGGNVKGSINIPLNTLSNKLGKFKKEESLVVCCASGSRSRAAQALLQSNGFTKVYNGGSWYSLNKYKR